MHMNMGTAFFGGTGTGKTETVRDFSKAIGNMCFSYSCAAEISCRMLSQYLSGICSSGTLCCFDDFHKLTSSVLNVVIYYMQVIKTCRDVKKDSVLINAREVPLIATSAYFVTMNYLKCVRKELYAIVMSSLRPCAMFESENRVVAEVLLCSSGFTAAPILARKLSSFCQLAERNLSEESHYSFGMRNIKQVSFVLYSLPGNIQIWNGIFLGNQPSFRTQESILHQLGQCMLPAGDDRELVANQMHTGCYHT